MKALIAIAAITYAIALWMFAPESRWQKEVATAKAKQQNRLTATPTPEPETNTQTDTTPEPNTTPDYSQWTINQLRELAKQKKLNWRPLVNGKRKPLNKPQLIALLITA